MPAIDPQQIAPARARQIELSEHELEQLGSRIRDDYNQAISDHQARMDRYRGYYRAWRGLAEPVAARSEDEPNFRYPLTQWHTYLKWATELDSIFGDDAEIVANPRGPTDARNARLVSAFLTWRVLESMKITRDFALFTFRKILFGRSHALSAWERRTFSVPLVDGSEQEDVAYEGPGFEPLWPDDVILPAEADAKTVQDFSFVIRRFRAAPDDLLRDEEHGTYVRVSELWSDIVATAEDRRQRSSDGGDEVKREADLAEGVLYDSNLSAGARLEVWAWYGRWRLPTTRRPTREDNLKARERYERDLLVYYIPDLDEIIGVIDLAEMYPRTPNRRPIVEAAMTRDGTYWCQGYGELLLDLEAELSSTHNLGTRAGQFSVGPVVFYNPAAGFDAEHLEYTPFTMVPCENPAGVNPMYLRADLTYPTTRTQELLATGERVTGQSDMNLGRASDRPNAPRTYGQTVQLLNQGNIRASIDTTMLREDMGDVCQWFWALEGMYGSPTVFFRVTEQRAEGYFDVQGGFAKLTSKEYAGRYDFSIKFATGYYGREARKERQLALYQLDLGNPLIATNPYALWKITENVHRALGDEEFARMVPMPPKPDEPMEPGEEWTRMLQGEAVYVHPHDHDVAHRRQHEQDLSDALADVENRDMPAIRALQQHIAEHLEQAQQKRLMNAMMGQLVNTLARNIGTGTGIQPGGMPANLMQIQQTLAELTGQGGAQPAQPGQPGQPLRPGTQ